MSKEHRAESFEKLKVIKRVILNRNKTNYKFRFKDIQIWQQANEISNELFFIAGNLEEKKLYRIAKQLRGAVMSTSNNIAEVSGLTSSKDFKYP